MVYWDQHCHSEHSFDSVEKIENYLYLANHDIVTTEHLDINAPNIGTVACDDTAYTNAIEQLEQRTGFRVHKGLEMGYADHSIDELKAYLENKTYDICLLSVHEAEGRYDFMTPVPKREIGAEKTLELYYESCIRAIEHFPDFDVFTHLDCPFRAFAFDMAYMPVINTYLPTICRKLVEKEIALELNTRSMYQYGNLEYYRYLVRYYKNAGGTYFSLGSDAHSKEIYEYHFQDALEFMVANDLAFLVQFTRENKKILKAGDVYENYGTKSGIGRHDRHVYRSSQN